MSDQAQPSQTTADDPDLEHLERIARLMDSAVSIPGTNLRIGLDSIVGLVPGAGDTLALLPALYIIGMSWRMGAPKRVIGRMALNTGIDTAVGSIPLLGDLFDAGFKSNRRNVALLRGHMETKKAAARRAAA